MGKPKQRKPKRQLVYEGERGLCPCCGRPTDVRIGSTLGTLLIRAWTVPEDILSIMYLEVAKRVKRRTRHNKEQLYVTDPSEYDATIRNKFFFVGTRAGEIAGPFGPTGLKVFLTTSLDADSNTNSITIYIVSTTSRTLPRIVNSPYARERDVSNVEDHDVEPF